ncbi:TonB family protein [Alcanivorax sp. S6407]|uniref:TonB family protein n=1 Tax=Alcanivorax sp. S6407 TaxID=2926424 RepID=UPI001FF2F2A8|nr:TonB family protein [Alcanivorax sp. S6407]MCK0152326.1 TonB family protein [Alcanivorax sp. S6407]
MTQENKKKLRILIDGTLPWDKQEGEDRRLYGFVIVFLILCLLLMFVVESVTIEKPDRREQQKIPDRLAQMVLEKKKEPPPPEPEPEPEPEEEKPKEEPKPEEPKPEPKPEPRPEPTPERREEARATAKAKLEEDLGDSLAGLDDIGPLVATGNELRTGGSSEAKAERDLIGKRASAGSGGVAVAKASSGGGGGGTLSSGTVGGGQVDSKIASSGQAASTTRKGSDGKSRRTQEQLRRVFDRYAGKFNSQYQRALRSNPALQGTVVLSLVIAPSGEVTDAKIKSSQLGDDKLERRILLIAKGMNFGAMNVETWKGDYKLNFFPN